jgi:GT2 family glycosyltransferase
MTGRADARARIAVVVLNYRTPELTGACLESLVPQLDAARDAVVVVDNASGDGSPEKLRRLADERGFRCVRVLESPRNGGFAAGNNLGIAAVGAQAYLLLNSDTLVRPGAIELLWTALERRPGVGIVGPRIEYEDGTPQPSCFRFPSPWSELVAAADTEPVRRLLEAHDVLLPIPEAPCSPDWTSFCAALVRAEVFERVGPLDEGFFMYFEDVDYCRRARAAGFEISHEPRARVIHHCGGTSPMEELAAAGRRRPEYYYAARSRYFRKARGRAGLLAANLLWSLGRLLAWLRERVGHKRERPVEGELLAIWRG